MANTSEAVVKMAVANEEVSTITLTSEQEMILNFWLKMEPQKRKILWPVFTAYDNADTDWERQMIVGTLKECLFRPLQELWVDGIGEPDRRNPQGLTKHRAYVGQQIRELRERQHMSQQELAEKAGIPQSHVSRLENGKHTATYLTVKRIAQALNTRPSVIDPGFSD